MSKLEKIQATLMLLLSLLIPITFVVRAVDGLLNQAFIIVWLILASVTALGVGMNIGLENAKPSIELMNEINTLSRELIDAQQRILEVLQDAPYSVLKEEILEALNDKTATISIEDEA